MSTDQPPPGSDEPPHGDPFGKPPPPSSGGSSGGRWGGSPGGPFGGRPAGGSSGGWFNRRSNGEPYRRAEPLAGMAPLAGLGRRLVARIVDALIIGIPVAVIAVFAAGGRDAAEESGTTTGISIVYALVYFVYEGLMLTAGGQTVGKKLMKIRVAMLHNGAVPAGRPGWLRAAVYSLPEVVPCCGSIFWLLNALWCTWDRPYRQCLHDKVAQTVVVSAVR